MIKKIFDLQSLFYSIIGNKIFYVYILTLLSVVLESIGLMAVLPIFTDSTQGGELRVYYSEFVKFIGLPDVQISYIYILAAFFVFKGLMSLFAYFKIAEMKGELLSLVKKLAFRAAAKSSYQEYIRLGSGKYIDLIDFQVNRYVQCFYAFAMMIVQLISVLVFVLLAFKISPEFGAISALISIAIIYTYKSLNKYVHRNSVELSNINSNLSGLISQYFINFKYFKATDSSELFNNKIFSLCDSVGRKEKIMSASAGFTNSVREPIAVLSLALIFFISYYFFGVEFSSMAVSSILFYRSVGAVMMFQAYLQTVLTYSGSVFMIEDFIAQTEISISNNSTHVRRNSLSNKFSDDNGLKNIIFENVTYEYPDQSIGIRNINLNLSAGHKYLVVGDSGSGKSTLMNLALGVLKPTQGSIKYHCANSLSETETHNLVVGYVPQEPILFAGSLMENITLSPDSFSKNKPYIINRVVELLKAVGLFELIAKSSDGLYQEIYSGGDNLSGGQRVRIILARELFKDPDVLVLDEISSGLDYNSIELISGLLNKLSKCILLEVSHKFNSKLNYNKVIVLGDSMLVSNNDLISEVSDPSSYVNRMSK